MLYHIRRWHVLLLIVGTLVAFCGLAAAKLRATPKYDRIQVGMTEVDVEAILGDPLSSWAPGVARWDFEEGRIGIEYQSEPQPGPGHRSQPEYISVVKEKAIKRRTPLQRIAWLLGWQEPQPIRVI